MSRFRQENSEGQRKPVVLALFFIAYSCCGTAYMLQIAHVLIFLSKCASLHLLAAFIAILLPGLALAKTIKPKRSTKKAAENLSKEDTIFRGLLLTAILLLFVWVAMQASLVVYIEAEYAAMRNNYRKLLLSYLEAHGEKDLLSAAWNVILTLKQEFKGTYGLKVLIPNMFSIHSFFQRIHAANMNARPKSPAITSPKVINQSPAMTNRIMKAALPKAYIASPITICTTI